MTFQHSRIYLVHSSKNIPLKKNHNKPHDRKVSLKSHILVTCIPILREIIGITILIMISIFTKATNAKLKKIQSFLSKINHLTSHQHPAPSFSLRINKEILQLHGSDHSVLLGPREERCSCTILWQEEAAQTSSISTVPSPFQLPPS